MSEFRKDIITNRFVIITNDRIPINTRKENYNGYAENDINCPFCEGNEAMTPTEIFAISNNTNRKANQKDWKIRVVPNQNIFLKIETPIKRNFVGIYDSISGFGAHERIIETPIHISRIYKLDVSQLQLILETYKARLNDLKNDTRIKYIMIYKNQLYSASYHLHSHIMGMPIIPKLIEEELYGAKKYFDFKDRCIYCDIINEELKDKSRLIYENKDFICFSPFASRFPFEICVLPKNHSHNFDSIDRMNINSLADFLKIIFNKLFNSIGNTDFNLIFHNSPINSSYKEENFKGYETYYHWHIEILPDFHNIQGFEKGSGFYINPIKPEIAAEYMRKV